MIIATSPYGRRLSFALIACLALLPACGGGGGGGGGGDGGDDDGTIGQTTNGEDELFLRAAFFARPLFDVEGTLESVYNPASLLEVDPLTGVTVEGFPKTLVAGADPTELGIISFKQILDPITPQIPVIPRNGAIILEFTKDLAPASLLLSDIDPDAPGKLTSASPVQVRNKDGTLALARAVVIGSRIILHARTETTVGWEASPLVFDAFGNALEDPTGHLRIVMGDGIGAAPLFSDLGVPLTPRKPDFLGTTFVPLAFNPGNAALDAVKLQTEAGAISFNGFLPDLTPPRIIRSVSLTGTVAEVDFSTPAVTGEALTFPAKVDAYEGKGEWTQSLLEVTGLGGLVTRYTVDSNVAHDIDAAKPVFVIRPGTALDPSVVPGSAYVVTRTEFFEPIPPPFPSDADALDSITVDSQNHPRDALDPQDQINHDLRYFVRAYDELGIERTDVWDPNANIFGPTKGAFGAIPPKSTLKLLFNEPMDKESFRPYETFYVTDTSVPDSEPAFSEQRVGRVEASIDLRTLAFAPFLEDQFDPAGSKFLGFGGTAGSLQLVIRTIPEQADLVAVLDSVTPEQQAQLVDLGTRGVLGITDLGGRGLGLPTALIDQADTANFFLQADSPGRGAFPPAIDFRVGFQTQPTTDPDYGAVVHRFMGEATTSTFTYPTGTVHDTVTSGIEYTDYPPLDTDQSGSIDRRFIYGPRVLDIGLNVPGRLTGAPATTIEHLIDDFNRPKPSPFASPQGQDFLAKLAFGTRLPLNSPYGCRFQHIYRPGDASPSFTDFAGVTLDLVGLAWSPIGNQVANTTIEEMSILVGLSPANQGRGPNTNQGSGIPDSPESGLRPQFDCNLLEYLDDCCLPLTNNINASLLATAPSEPPLSFVVRRGTPYSILQSKLFKPANAQQAGQGQFNYYLDYPQFNAGVDLAFGKTDVFSFPYTSRWPMVIEYRIDPAPENFFPSNNNAYRFSPGILSSALPRFRVWSQGQDPSANCVPSITLGCVTGSCNFYGGEGGPLLEPGTFNNDIPPAGGNQMPAITTSPYILPPQIGCTPNQPQPDRSQGDCGPPLVLPACNSLPEMNFYFANGMLAYPLPNKNNWPGPNGQPGTTFVGYGQVGINGAIPPNEPAYTCNPALYGDNSRYFMMWKYRKRVSIIESPTIGVDSPSGQVQYFRPQLDPPLDAVDAAAGLKVEFRAGVQLNFAVPVLESGYTLPDEADFAATLSGQNQDRVFVKFRATFATGNSLNQPPTIDTVVIPYMKVNP